MPRTRRRARCCVDDAPPALRPAGTERTEAPASPMPSAAISRATEAGVVAVESVPTRASPERTERRPVFRDGPLLSVSPFAVAPPGAASDRPNANGLPRTRHQRRRRSGTLASVGASSAAAPPTTQVSNRFRKLVRKRTDEAIVDDRPTTAPSSFLLFPSPANTRLPSARRTALRSPTARNPSTNRQPGVDRQRNPLNRTARTDEINDRQQNNGDAHRNLETVELRRRSSHRTVSRRSDRPPCCRRIPTTPSIAMHDDGRPTACLDTLRVNRDTPIGHEQLRRTAPRIISHPSTHNNTTVPSRPCLRWLSLLVLLLSVPFGHAQADSPANFSASPTSVPLQSNVTASPTVQPSIQPTLFTASPMLPPSSSPSPSKPVTASPTLPPSPTLSSSSPSSLSVTSPTELPSVPPTSSSSPSRRITPSPTELPSVPSTSTTLQPITSSPSQPVTPSPSQEPSFSPTHLPTASPTISRAPSSTPTLSSRPSLAPTVTFEPSHSPSLNPTTSTQPSASPSDVPSVSPSDAPSTTPTVQPTLSDVIDITERFRQQFTTDNGRIFNPTEVVRFQQLYEWYTIRFAPGLPMEDGRNIVEIITAPDGVTKIGRVNITCNIFDQVGLSRRRRGLGQNARWKEQRRPNKQAVKQLDDSPTPATADSVGYIRATSDDESFRELQSFVVNVDFTMRYWSRHTDVTEFPLLFQTYINENSNNVTQDLQSLGLNVTGTGNAFRISVNPEPTMAPTISFAPTQQPSVAPTDTVAPSMIPSSIPSFMPSFVPTETPVEATALPTRTKSASPTMTPPVAEESESPTIDEPDDESRVNENTIVVAAAVVVGALLLVALLIFYQRRKRRRQQQFLDDAAGGSSKVNGSGDTLQQQPKEGTAQPSKSSWNHPKGLDTFNHDPYSGSNGRWAETPYTSRGGPVSLYGADDDYYPPAGHVPRDGKNLPANAMGGNNPGIISPSESLVSSQSLLSAGDAMAADSGDEEADATQHLADEFDQYKDQNLEKMRTDIQGNLAGFDGMMSQALTKALIDDQYDDSYHYGNSSYSGTGSSWSNAAGDAAVPGSSVDSMWGTPSGAGGTDGQYPLSGIEIEASVLGEVTDWLKRKQNATIEERRAFMQGTLNKMVASVRHDVLGPDDASRAIHECAALLGLQLATEIPVTTLIVTGMRRNVTAAIMVESFQEFGEIAEAAVASNGKGCGILRFRNSKSAELAMQKFRRGEILVQDVDVQLKLLKPGSATDYRKGQMADRR